MRRCPRGALVVLLAAASGACATAGGSDDTTGGLGAGDASVDVGTGSEAAGPSPDAVVLGVDGAGDDASTGDDGTADPPDVGTDGHPSKSCAGLPDGTPCGASPDICHDAPVCAAGACAAPAAKANGFVCGTAPDICHDAPLCQSGSCAAPGAKADGFVCGTAPDGCHDAPACKAGSCAAPAIKPDGTNWTPGDGTARCCGGAPVHTTSNANCGACGIQCNGSTSGSCQDDNGVWLCRGCTVSVDCWSHCCSTSFSPNSCAASDCAGNCSAQYCPPGTHCVVGNGTSDYCSY